MLGAAYDALGELLHCDGRRDVAIVSSATAAWQRVFLGVPFWAAAHSCIVTAPAEYGSNYIAYLQARGAAGSLCTRARLRPSRPRCCSRIRSHSHSLLFHLATACCALRSAASHGALFLR